MIENGETKKDMDVQGRIPIWIRKALIFLDIFHAVENVVDVFGTDTFHSCTEKDEASEYCFVQIYQPIQEQQLRSDGFDKALESVRMQWNKTLGDTDTLSAAKEFRIILASAIRGSLNTVQ